ncbi:MAG: DoxX family protein [Pirellulaceae bacterium]
MFKRLLRTTAPCSLLLIRLMVGLVFLSEGLQKFMFPDQRGAGRFEKIGLPEPETLGYLVGTFEVLCGTLIVIGLLTRLASIPLIVIMLVALGTTKLPMLADDGFWEMAHAMRTDWAMLLGSLYLFLHGAGSCSADRGLTRKDTVD